MKFYNIKQLKTIYFLYLSLFVITYVIIKKYIVKLIKQLIYFTTYLFSLKVFVSFQDDFKTVLLKFSTIKSSSLQKSLLK